MGNKNASVTWVYLHGLTATINGLEERNHRILLDRIARQLNIRILAISSPFRCQQYQNKLCWPHETKDLVNQTYKYINELTQDFQIVGYIGFSNGGFFLHSLVQYLPIDKHIITIGASGVLQMNVQPCAKLITIIVGKNDAFHYEGALKFANQLKAKSVPVVVFEHEQGHIIPESILLSTLQLLKD